MGLQRLPSDACCFYHSYYFLSLKFHFMVPFSLFSHFQFPIQIAQVTVLFPLWVLFLFISQLKSMCFPHFIFVLHQLSLSTVDIPRQESAHYLLAVCNGFNPTTFFIEGKGFLFPPLLTLRQAPSYFRQDPIYYEYLSSSLFLNGKAL